jgi:uncharacterized membrane protein
MDLAFAVFYVVYAFLFNLAYDRVFPLPEWETARSGAARAWARGRGGA